MEQGLPDEETGFSLSKDKLIEIQAHVKSAWEEFLKIEQARRERQINRERVPTEAEYSSLVAFTENIRRIRGHLQFITAFGPWHGNRDGF